VSLAPKSFEGWTLLGNEQFNEGLYSRSVTSFEHALKISPNYLDALTGYCAGLYAVNRYNEIPAIATLGLKHPDATLVVHHYEVDG
jgi:cytochrome c-type biogenesis protein CcmH/NrfG